MRLFSRTGRRGFRIGTAPGAAAAAACLASALAVAALLGCGGEASRPEAAADRPVRIALHGGPSSLDPHLQSEVPAQIVLGHIYDSLVDFDVRLRPIPALAESWENPDAYTWRFHLRAGPRFHDGRPLEVADVIATLERARRHQRSRQAGALVAVAEIRQVGERSLELRTKKPYPILLNKLAVLSVVPRDAPEEIVDPIGTGPYRVVRKLAEAIELETVEGHWRLGPDHPRRYPRHATLHFLGGGEERLRGLLDGRYDVVDDLSTGSSAKVAGKPGVRLETLSSLSVTYLQLDVARPPWNDLRVRRAVDLLIDRDQLVREELAGRGEPAGQLVSANVFGFNPDLQPTRRDPEAARRLLAEAGYADGLEVEIEYRDGRDIDTIARQLEGGGLRVSGRTRPWEEMYRRLQSGEIGAYLGTWVCTSGDASDLLDRKLHTRDPERGWGDANWSRYSNEQLDRLIEESQQVVNPLDRGALLKKAMALTAADLPFVPLYSRSEVYGVRRELAWTPRRDGRIFAFEMRWP